MALKSGMNGSIGYIAEDTWGVAKPPTRFLPALPGVTLGQTVDWMEDDGIYAGRRVAHGDQMVQGRVTVAGTVKHQLYDHSMTLLLKHALGGYSVSAGPPYTHTITPGDLTGLSLTVQRGLPDVTDGTVRPYTTAGAKISKLELAWKEGEIVTAGLDMTGKWEIRHRTVADGVTNTDTSLVSATAVFTQDDVGKPVSGTGIAAGTTILSRTSATTVVLSAATTATATGVTITIGMALASVSYASSLIPVRFRDSTLTIAGTAVPVKEGKFTVENMLNTERRFCGTPYISEQLEAGRRKIGGSCVPEFANNTAYERFVNGTQAALVSTFTVGSNSITITKNVIFDGDPPKENGPEIIEQPLSYRCVGSTDAAACTIVAVNSDAAA